MTSDKINDAVPFYLKHPELNLKPISAYPQLTFWVKEPEYVEDPEKSSHRDYLYMVKNGKIGILYWQRKGHWLLGPINKYKKIVSCQYDRIEKKEDHFKCYTANKVVYYDFVGRILK